MSKVQHLYNGKCSADKKTRVCATLISWQDASSLRWVDCILFFANITQLIVSVVLPFCTSFMVTTWSIEESLSTCFVFFPEIYCHLMRRSLPRRPKIEHAVVYRLHKERSCGRQKSTEYIEVQSGIMQRQRGVFITIFAVTSIYSIRIKMYRGDDSTGSCSFLHVPKEH